MTVSSLITTAMVAWNEVYQGYPDHWIKVYGNLVKASEETKDEDLKILLTKEADTFYQAYSKQEKYRPTFESLACQAFGKETNTNLCGSVINGMLCYDCALKHISDAQVYFIQLKDNLEDISSFMYVLGNLSHAADHLVEQHEEISHQVREERKKFYNSYVGYLDTKDSSYIYEPDFQMLSTVVMGLI